MKSILLFFSIVCVSFTLAQAQQRLVEAGDRHYQDMAFVRALGYYQKAYNKDTADRQVILKIAESYRRLNDPVHSEPWYARVVNASDVSPIHKFYYAEALSSNGKYQQAKQWYKQYTKEAGQEQRVINRIEGIERQQAFYRNPSAITVEEAPFNTAQADFSPTFYDGNLVFVSARDEQAKSFDWDNSSYLDLYQVSPDNSRVTKLEGYVNTQYHEGPATFFDNGSKVIFTRSDYYHRKLSKSEEGVNKLKLFYAEKQADGSWGKPQPLPFNSSEYSTGHPTLSSDRTLYFVSDRPGGFGGTDLYKCAFVDGAWQQPVNLGANVNTEGDEMFPYLHQDRELYFASNGRPGLGGLDIFGIEMQQLASGKAINLGSPINTPADDFGLLLDSASRSGYFSSNRAGGTGSDDIYHFTNLQPLLFPYLVKGKVTDEQEGSPLAEAKVSLIADGEPEVTTQTAKDGSYTFFVQPDLPYQVRAAQTDYVEQTRAFSTVSESRQTAWEVNLALPKYEFSLYGVITEAQTDRLLEGVHITLMDHMTKEILLETTTDIQGAFEYVLVNKKLDDRISYRLKLSKEGYLGKASILNHQLTQPGRINWGDMLHVSLDRLDIGKLAGVQPIYFETGQHAIRPEAAAELDKVVEIMQENPTIKIELGAHTDARGSAAANLLLSDRRSKACADYMISQGIGKDRIVGKGYGESMVVNRCKDGVKCSEEEYQENRRTEFKVTKF